MCRLVENNFIECDLFRVQTLLLDQIICTLFLYHLQSLLLFDRAQIICNMGDALGPELATCLPIFLDRLKNEITRLTAVKALSMIAE